MPAISRNSLLLGAFLLLAIIYSSFYITNYSSPPNSPLNLTGPIEIISFIEPNPEISLPLYEFFS